MLLPARGDGAREAIYSACETLVRTDLVFLRKHPECPPLAKAGIRYQKEPPGQPETWWSIPEVIIHGYGDCKKLAAWRVAELRIRDVAALCYPITNGNGKWHIIVAARVGGKTVWFDPSKELGM